MSSKLEISVGADDVGELGDRTEGEEGGVKDVFLEPCGYGGRLLWGVNVADH